jgi:hypothetical protein
MDWLSKDHVETPKAREKRCFLLGPCKVVIRRKIEASAIRTLNEGPSIFIRDKPTFSAEKMLHKDYYRKGSVEKNLWSWVSRGLTRQQTDWW